MPSIRGSATYDSGLGRLVHGWVRLNEYQQSWGVNWHTARCNSPILVV